MVRDFWPLAVAVIIALVATLRPFINIAPAKQEAGEHLDQVDLRHWDQSRQPLLKLSGQWRYFPDQLLEPEQIPLQLDGGHWVSAPHFFAGAQHYRADSPAYGSYLLNVNLAKTTDLGLSLPSSCSSTKVYFYPRGSADKQPLFEVGRVHAQAKYNRNSLARHHRSFGPQLPPGEYQLLIQVASHHSATGGLCVAPILGKFDTLQNLHSFQQLSHGLVIAIVFSFGLYAVGTYISGSRNRSYLWLGANALLVALAAWSTQNFWVTGFGLDEHSGNVLAYGLVHALGTICGPLIVGFVHHSFRVHFVSNRLISANLLLGILLSLPFLFLTVASSRPLIVIIPLFGALQFIFALYLLWQINRRRLPYGRRITLYLIPLFAALFYQLATYLGLVQAANYLLASVVFLTVAQGLTQSQKLARASQVASRLSQGLSDAVLERTSALHLKNQELLRTQKELTRANSELQTLSITDGLTQVYNRMHFDRQLLIEWQRARRESSSLCLMLLDVDHFKRLNDQYGHTSGDEALRQVAKILTDKFKRGVDFVCRYGGEEFVVILSNTLPEQATSLAEDVRTQVQTHRFMHSEQRLQLTVSIGICGTVPKIEYQPQELINCADQALYQAKRNGRNQVVCAQQPQLVNT